MALLDSIKNKIGFGEQEQAPTDPFARLKSRQGLIPRTADLKTSKGLYDLATKVGLKNQADRIVQLNSGEDTKKIFSGGFISDTFDVLNALDYGVVGLLQGKGFKRGIQERSSFSDQDALGQYGARGAIAGLVLDIAVDPLTYAGGFGLLGKASKASGLSKLAELAKGAVFGKKVLKSIEGVGDIKNLTRLYETVEGGTKLGKYLGSKFAWMFGVDPIYRQAWERSVKNIGVTTQYVSKLGKSVAGLAPETAAKILVKDEAGRFLRRPLAELAQNLKPEELKPVAEFYSTIDNLGKEAVDLGLLSKETYEKNIGEYIKNAYTEYETTKGTGLFGFTRTGIKGIKKRKQVADVAEFGLTQVDNPAYLLFKSAADLTRDVENAKLLRIVNRQLATDVAQDGFTQLGSGKKWGEAAGKFIPDNVKMYLDEIVEPSKDTLARRAVANFKFFKVVMSPGTHARNILSNKALNYWKLGMNPLDPRVIKTDSIALSEIAKGSGKWIDEATPLGYNLDTFASAEMRGLLEQVDPSVLGKAKSSWSNIKKKLGDLYQAEENYAKLSAYIFNRSYKGLGPEEAWKAAESATFNYAQVTPFVRKLRESLFGFPFITFTVKSTPVALETALKNPQRISVIGKIKSSIEGQSDPEETARERASEPAWVRNGFYIKLPMKDKEGRSAYFDMTYILPFGDLLAGNFFERSQNLETGVPEGATSAALRRSPFLNLVGELYKNKDFYGNSIWRESDPTEKQLTDVMRHLTKAYLPNIATDFLPGGYNRRGERQQRGVLGAAKPNEKPDQKRTVAQELLRLIGAKIQPIDADIQETYQEWNIKKGLSTLLRDNGIVDDFNVSYIPKK